MDDVCLVSQMEQAVANENREIMPEWMTPAEALQLARQTQILILREENFFTDPEHMQAWNQVKMFESCVRWWWGVI